MKKHIKYKNNSFIAFLCIAVITLTAFADLIPNPTQSTSKNTNAQNVQENLKSLMKKCYEIQGANRCYEKTARELLVKASYEDILKAVESNEQLPEITTHCHEMLHFLGRIEYQHKKDIRDVLNRSSGVCLAGSYHGAVEGYFIDKKIPLNARDDSIYTAEFPKICGSRSSYKKEEIYNQCNHGLGHAMMLVTEDEIPRSLKLCDSLNGIKDQEMCYTGVFMENFSSSTNSDHPSKYIKDNDKLYPCDILEKGYLRICYSLLAPRFLKISNYNWPEAIQLCNSIPEAFKIPCFSTLGSDQVGSLAKPKEMIDNCKNISIIKYLDACLQGTVRHLIIRYSGNTKLAMELCSGVSNKYKQNCYSQLGFSLRDWVIDQTQLNKTCEIIQDTTYSGFCIKPDFIEQKNK